MSKTTYHVRVSTFGGQCEGSRQLGECHIFASSLEDAEAQRAEFTEDCLEHEEQSHVSNMWVYDPKTNDWTELGGRGVIFG